MVSVSPGFIKIFTLTRHWKVECCIYQCVFLVHMHENVLVHANACVAMCMGCSIVPHI